MLKTIRLSFLLVILVASVLFVILPSQFSAQESGVIVLRGTPAETGRQHGTKAKKRIRLMVSEYIGDELVDGKLNDKAGKQIAAMKGSLPKWYLEELNACADVVELDRDVLLYAQCEGDIRSLPGCTTYVAFDKATADGKLEIGRNLDYWGLQSTEKCVSVFAVIPSEKGHYAFVSVGWTGILGGWTLLNEKGLFVANNLGGFRKKNPKGIPTLILTRIIAQKCATIDEAINLIKSSPRMRGQAIILGSVGNPEKNIKPSSAVVLYDAEKVVVKRPTDGFIFHTSIGTNEQELRKNVKAKKMKVYDAIKAAGTNITLHSVAIDPSAKTIWIAHGKRPGAHTGKYVSHNYEKLLVRKP